MVVYEPTKKPGSGSSKGDVLFVLNIAFISQEPRACLACDLLPGSRALQEHHLVANGRLDLCPTFGTFWSRHNNVYAFINMVKALWPPPEVIATWPQPNYVDPPNRGPGLEYCSIILTSLGIVVVAARLYSRFFVTRAPGIDDLLIVIAAACGIALTVLVIIGNKKYHSGYHIWDVEPSTGPGHRLNVWISQWCYLWSTGAIKISVLLFYRRISVSFNRSFYCAVWAGIAYNIAMLLGFSVALITLCDPTEAYWLSFSIPWLIEHHGDRHCTYEGISLTLAGVFSIIGDLYSALLPSLLIVKLQTPARQKLMLTLLFAVGYAVVGLGIGRTIALNRVVFHDYDYTWELWSAWIWSVSELWIGLMAASAPSLKPLFSRYIFQPLTSAMHSASKMSRNYNASPDLEISNPKPEIRSFTFFRSTRSKPTPPSTELSYASSKPSASLHSQDAADWPMPPDVEKSAHTWYSAMPTPEMHNFRYTGGGRCWSEASNAAANKRPIRSKSKRNSSGQIENTGRILTRNHHRRNRTADSPSTRELCQVDRSTSQPSAESSGGRSPHLSPLEIGAAYSIDRTVEWSVLEEQTSAEPDLDGRILTRSIVDLEQRVEQFNS